MVVCFRVSVDESGLGSARTWEPDLRRGAEVNTRVSPLRAPGGTHYVCVSVLPPTLSEHVGRLAPLHEHSLRLVELRNDVWKLQRALARQASPSTSHRGEAALVQHDANTYTFERTSVALEYFGLDSLHVAASASLRAEADTDKDNTQSTSVAVAAETRAQGAPANYNIAALALPPGDQHLAKLQVQYSFVSTRQTEKAMSMRNNDVDCDAVTADDTVPSSNVGSLKPLMRRQHYIF